MTLTADILPRKSRLSALLKHCADVEDPRDVRRILHPLPKILFLVVCGTITDCDDYEGISAWGAAHLGFLRRYLPYAEGVPGERWLTILMNRINPALFSAAFSAWVRESWPSERGGRADPGADLGADLVAIDGKTSRRSHDRSAETRWATSSSPSWTGSKASPRRSTPGFRTPSSRRASFT